MVVLPQPAKQTPTRSRHESAKERAQVKDQERAALARNSGVMLLPLFLFVPTVVALSFSSAWRLARGARWSLWMSLLI